MAYSDFKSYIQTEFGDYLQNEIIRFVGKSVVGANARMRFACQSDNLEVKAIRCSDMPGMFIKIEIYVTADIIFEEPQAKASGSERVTRWFTVTVVACLTDGIEIDVDKTSVIECDQDSWGEISFFEEFGIPCIHTADLENIANDFCETCCQDAIYYMYQFPYDYVIERLGIKAYEADLPENIFGRMYFKEDNATVYRKFQPRMEAIKLENVKIEPGTMLISKDNYFMIENGCYTMTITHEIVHWLCHQKFFKIISLLDENLSVMSCDVEPQKFDDNMTNLQKAMWFAEWQANALGMRLAMPQVLFVQAIEEAYESAVRIPRKNAYYAEVWEDAIYRVAKLFGVSEIAAKQRAIQLGWDVAAGTHLYIDGKIHSPFLFRKGTLGMNQTFVIDKEGVAKLCEQNLFFNSLLRSGRFVYIGYVVCINNDKYIREAEDYEKLISGYDYELTDYAREHVDECCLIFDWESVSGSDDDGGFYGQCYLSKDISAYNRVEHHFNPQFEFNQDKKAVDKEIAKYLKIFKEEEQIKKEMQEQGVDGTFSTALIYHMKRKNVTIEKLVSNSQLSATTIKKYRKGLKPGLENLMAIFIGLNLSERLCDQLLELCGYSVNEKGPLLEHKVYRELIRNYSDGNIDQWNAFLEGCGMNKIPNQKNQKISK